MPLILQLNGLTRDFPDLFPNVTLDRLVAEMGLKEDRVAVEHNGEIVPRARWTLTTLAANDRLEVVHFVGGGSVASSSAIAKATVTFVRLSSSIS